MRIHANKIFTVLFVLALSVTVACAQNANGGADEAPEAIEDGEKDSYKDGYNESDSYAAKDGEYLLSEADENPLYNARGMNIGNALEAPRNVFWGVEMREEYFDYIKDAGFDTVRLPVRFSDYTQGDDYVLDEDFMAEIDHYINYALERDLKLVLVFHHFKRIMFEPHEAKQEFLSVWQQLSERYRNYPVELVFEVLNEPTDNLKGDLWNEFLDDAVGVIRENDPFRYLVVGGDNFNSAEAVEWLVLPDTNNLIVTFHYYVPNDFAFQGNAYHPGFEHLESITWTGDDGEMERLRTDFENVRQWAEENNVPVFVGEFGVVKTVPFEYRGAWTEAVREMAEEHGFSWSYWELASHFGIFDADTNEWDEDMLEVLLD